MDLFPQQANGYGGTNFGNQCYNPKDGYVYDAPGITVNGVYSYDETKNALLDTCRYLADDIQYCQV